MPLVVASISERLECAGARVLDVWVGGRHIELRQPVVTNWASIQTGSAKAAGRVMTPMPGKVTKVHDQLHFSSLRLFLTLTQMLTLTLTPTPTPDIVAVQVFAQDGDRVSEGDAILELSSMKLFYAVNAPCAGTLTGLSAAPGDQVSSGEVLCDVVVDTEDTAAPASAA